MSWPLVIADVAPAPAGQEKGGQADRQAERDGNIGRAQMGEPGGARRNDLAHADLASAQAAFLRGDVKTAREIAMRAKGRFPVGSPGWVKADDIASYKPPQNAFNRN